jgi:hypothetical protein
MSTLSDGTDRLARRSRPAISIRQPTSEGVPMSEDRRTNGPSATRRRGRLIAVCAATAAALGIVAMDLSGQTAEEVQNTIDDAIETRQDTQRAQDAWQAERTALVARYRAAQADVSYLEERRGIEQSRLSALDDRIAELERRIAESVRLAENLEDTLRTLLYRLDSVVATGLPFLPEERAERLAGLREELVRPDAAGAEQLRRVLEAFQIEAQYGSTVEVYQDRITLGDSSVYADILRLGRLSLFWMTPDGGRLGRFDQATGAWVELPRKYRRSIRQAMEMATRLRPAAIVDLPIGKVAP